MTVFAPCMGLERVKVKSSFITPQFAPCMGLERLLLVLRLSIIEFAPCMGLESNFNIDYDNID